MKQMNHQKNIFKKLVMNESFYKEAASLKTIFKDSIWWVTERGKKISLLTTGGIKCPIFSTKAIGKSSCDSKLRRIMYKAKRKKGMVRFDCGPNKFGMCFPMLQGNKIYGYILLCNSKSEISDAVAPLFINFIETLLRELQKESELSKLYSTIRPRAIALSTIHTIHRIISSTLNMDELLPKLARLCLQVLRAEKCSIILKHPRREPVIVRATTVEEKNKRAIDRACMKFLSKKKIVLDGKVFMDRNKLCVPLTDEDVTGAIFVANKADKTPFGEFDREILTTLSEQAAIAIKNAQLYKKQENVTIGSVQSLAAILNTRATGTYKVKESFIKIVLAIGKALNLRTDDLKNLHYAAILHDAGQITFPDELLSKTDKLTGKDYSIIKRHPLKSVSIIKHMDFMKPVIPIILHHHENFDGSGYPKGLKREEIPLGARIMAVAGAFSAMVTKRPYRKKVDIKSAVSEIQKNCGTQFDPRVIEVFSEVIKDKEINRLLEKGL